MSRRSWRTALVPRASDMALALPDDDLVELERLLVTNDDAALLAVVRAAAPALLVAIRRGISSTPLTFWSRVVATPDGCLLWTGPTHSQNGYPVLTWEGHKDYAHRVAYLLTHGSLDPLAKVARTCRQILCIAPDHLRAMTQSGAVQRGRAAHLTWDAVHEIRELAATRVPHRMIAGKYNVSIGTISSIVRRVTWREDAA